MIKRIALFTNPVAGQGKAKKVTSYIESHLHKLRLGYTSFSREWPASIGDYSDVFVIGGDGTLNRFINQYPECALPISLFKGGTGNDFAWQLYRNMELQDYLDIALGSNEQPVDAGMCNGKYFINGVGIGFDGDVVKSMLKRKNGHTNRLGYLSVVLSKIFSYRENSYSIEIGNRQLNRDYFLLSVTNGSRFGGGFQVSPKSIINDGMLDLVLIDPVSPLQRLLNLPKVRRGQHLHLPFVETMRIQKVVIRSDRMCTGHMDGELIEHDFFEIQILPKKFLFRF